MVEIVQTRLHAAAAMVGADMAALADLLGSFRTFGQHV